MVRQGTTNEEVNKDTEDILRIRAQDAPAASRESCEQYIKKVTFHKGPAT